MARRRILQLIVCVSCPPDMRVRDAMAEVRTALRWYDPAQLSHHTVSPIPLDRMVRKRRSPRKIEKAAMADLFEERA